MSVELLVAWRHLRDADKRARWTLIVGLALLALGGIAWFVSAKLGARIRPYEMFSRHSYWRWAVPLKITAMSLGFAGALVTGLGITFRLFTAFTTFAIFGVFLGAFAPTLALSIMSGFEADLKSKIRGAKADVVVSPSGDQPFTAFDDVRRKLLAIPGVVAATPFIEAEVMIRAGQTPAGAVMRGIDPQTATEVLDLGRSLREGSLEALDAPAPAKPPGKAAAPDDAVVAPVEPGILLGEELYARILRVFSGEELRVTCPLCGISPAGPIPKQRTFRVAGHFYTGMYEFDSKLVYVSLAAAQKFLNMPGEVTSIDVRTATPEAALAVADAARAQLGAAYDVLTWEDLNRALFLALKAEKMAMFIALTLIALVASFSIVSIQSLMVTEKAREVAILKTMGARDGSILRIFLLEGLYTGLLGAAIGSAAGVGACQALARFGLPLPSDIYYIEKMPIVMRAGDVAITAGVAVLMCCVAAVYPALLASRVRPVEGLKYE